MADRITELSERVTVLYRALNPQAFNNTGAGTWFHRMLTERGVDVSGATVYRWIRENRIPDESLADVEDAITALSLEAQVHAKNQILMLEMVR